MMGFFHFDFPQPHSDDSLSEMIHCAQVLLFYSAFSEEVILALQMHFALARGKSSFSALQALFFYWDEKAEGGDLLSITCIHSDLDGNAPTNFQKSRLQSRNCMDSAAAHVAQCLSTTGMGNPKSNPNLQLTSPFANM